MTLENDINHIHIMFLFKHKESLLCVIKVCVLIMSDVKVPEARRNVYNRN